MSLTNFAARVRGAPTTADALVPGFRLGPRIAGGATTEAWVARPDDGRGGPRAVLLCEDTPVARERAHVVAGLGHPHLLRIEEVCTAADGRLAVVVEELGVSLEEVLARIEGEDAGVDAGESAPLDEDEIAGLLDGLGSALGRLHEAGLVHGDVAARNVLTDGAGRVVLVDLLEDPAGLRGNGAGGGGAPSEAGDVADLAALVLRAAGGHAGASPAVLRALGPYLDAAGARGGDSATAGAVPGASARALAAGAAMVGRAGRLRPERCGGVDAAGARGPARRPDPEPTPHAGGAGGWGRRVRGVAAWCAVGLVVGVGAGLLVRGIGGTGPWGDGPPSGASEVAAAADVPDAAEIDVALAALTARRDAALRDLDAEALAEVTRPGSAAAAQDAALLGALREAGERPVELTTTVRDATEVTEVTGADGTAVAGEGPAAGGSGEQRVRIVEADVVQEESVRSGPGGRRTVPALPQRCVRFTLVETDGVLEIAEAVPCPSA